MLRVKFIIISSFLLFLSCAKSAPDGIMDEDEMSELLTEVAMIDGYLNTLMIDSAKKVLPVLYGNAFRKYNIDSTQFQKNLQYYLGNPPLAEKVYTQVNNSLKKLEREYFVEDSIRNVFVQDSVSRVYRIQANAMRMRNALLEFRKVSTLYNYYDNSIYFKDLVPFKINPIELRKRQDVLGVDSIKITNALVKDSIKSEVEELKIDSNAKEIEVLQIPQPSPTMQQPIRNSSKPKKLEVIQAAPKN